MLQQAMWHGTSPEIKGVNTRSLDIVIPPVLMWIQAILEGYEDWTCGYTSVWCSNLLSTLIRIYVLLRNALRSFF